MTTPGGGSTIKKRYPSNSLTPAGGCHLLKGDRPIVRYRSYDDAILFDLMGPGSLVDPTTPESVRLLDIKGLIPPWKNLRQKGATEDGATYVTSLYDPIDIDLTVMIRGRDPVHAREVLRAWIDSWDAKQPGTLSWFTPEMGYWWTQTRWEKNPVDPMIGGNFTRQKLQMVASVDCGFWRSYPTTDVFAYSYLTATDAFTTNTSGAHNLGSNWTIHYNGVGDGYMFADGTSATSTLEHGACGVAQYNGYVSESDEQIVTITLGARDTWPAASDTYIDIWLRMHNSGTPGADGLRCRLGYIPPTPSLCGPTQPASFVRLSYFVSGVETLLREDHVTVPFEPGDQIAVAAGGYSGHLNSYFVSRGTNPNVGLNNVSWSNIMTVVNTQGDGSHVGVNYRGAGFGMQADGTNIVPSVYNWTAGDSTASEEAGYVTLYNVGDQDMWPFYILVGPGLFGIGDGPNATQAVTYGPLQQNQVVFINTDPNLYGVIDLTSMPPPGTPASSQFISQLSAALAEYNAFLSAGIPAPNLSVFGTPFPQGNPYSLLSGRFSRPIPAKLPGSSAKPQQIAVAVEGGGPTTAILAAGIPYRRYPQ
jgi:hypothetical protein